MPGQPGAGLFHEALSLFADLNDRPALVVGGGAVAERKTLALLEAGAAVTVGAPGLTPALAALAADGRIRHHPGRFDPAWLDAVWLVVAATDDTEVNREVSEAAEARRLFCNVVDDPALSSFQVPSIVDRSPVIVAISSSGVAPVLARRLRERIESLFDHTLGQLAGLAERYRQRIRAGHPDLGARRRFYDWLLDGPVAGLLRQQRPDQAEAALAAALDQPCAPPRAAWCWWAPDRGPRPLDAQGAAGAERGRRDHVRPPGQR